MVSESLLELRCVCKILTKDGGWLYTFRHDFRDHRDLRFAAEDEDMAGAGADHSILGYQSRNTSV